MYQTVYLCEIADITSEKIAVDLKNKILIQNCQLMLRFAVD